MARSLVIGMGVRQRVQRHRPAAQPAEDPRAANRVDASTRTSPSRYTLIA